MANSPAANRARIAVDRSEVRAKCGPGEAWAKLIRNPDDIYFARCHGRLVKDDPKFESPEYTVKPKEL